MRGFGRLLGERQQFPRRFRRQVEFLGEHAFNGGALGIVEMIVHARRLDEKHRNGDLQIVVRGRRVLGRNQKPANSIEHGSYSLLTIHPGSMPRFLNAGAAPGEVRNLTNAFAASACLVPETIPLEKVVNSWTSAGNGPA